MNATRLVNVMVEESALNAIQHFLTFPLNFDVFKTKRAARRKNQKDRAPTTQQGRVSWVNINDKLFNVQLRGDLWHTVLCDKPCSCRNANPVPIRGGWGGTGD